MKKFVYIIALLLIAGCVSQKDIFTLSPCSFDVRITLVKGSRVNFIINPSDESAGYFYSIVSSYDPSYNDAPMTFISSELEWMKQRYDLLVADADYTVSFADIYCYRGTREMRKTDLVSGTDHKLYVAQVNPVTMELIGEPCMTQFRTLDIEKTDLTFQLDFQGEKLTITPSRPDAAYIWDYENKDLIEYKYYSPKNFFMSLVYMYEDYNFVESITDSGAVEWVFSQEDNDMVEGETCTLTIAGYEGGEVVTDIFTQDFVYHKGNVVPLE